MRPSLGLSSIVFAGFLGLACSARVDDDTDPEGSEAAISETAPDHDAPLVVKDPRTLMDLEKVGFAFADAIGARGTTGKALLGSAKYRSIVDTLDRDLASLRERDPASGVGFDFLHRQFDPKWLRSAQSRFELIGVVNRIDRRAPSSCGDFRVIYRLAYTAKLSEGRLPMTISFVFPQKDDGQGCASVAQRWLDAKSGSAAALLEGPLKDHAPAEWIDVNLQAVRWPSNARRELGGESEYILRTFWVKGNNVGPQALENTPRTDLSPEDREELRKWIRENLDAIDKGTAVLPEKFLATRAISVGPLGLSRLANRPFSQIFGSPDAAFGDLPLDKTSQLGSVAALMRRLDGASCQGCHQSNALAGFHLLGEERDSEQRLNALAVGRSNHFADDLVWRTQFLNAVAKKGSFDTPRPLADHGANDGRIGAHCGLGDPGFRSWTCAAGLECVDHHGGAVGVCSPTTAPIGDTCVASKVSSNADPHADGATGHKTTTCDQDQPNAKCNAVKLGFPDGLCTAACTDDDAGKIAGKTICGGIPSAAGLTKCLTVDRLPFKECLATTMNPSLLRTCDATDPCRDDYACMRVKNGPANTGACMPPYFAFQARVDGHTFDE
jgi:hypothetical protein